MITEARGARRGTPWPFPTVGSLLSRLGLTAACLATLVLLTGIAAPARADVTVTVAPTSVTRGDRVSVSVVTSKKAKWCSFYTRQVGARRKLVSSKKATRGRASVQLRTASLSPGTYTALVFCGKAERGRSGRFTVAPAPQTSPEPTGTSPTNPPTFVTPEGGPCEPVELGGSYRSSRGAASAGVRIHNGSSSLEATWVEVTVNFWSGDAIMATDSHYVELIPPGESALAGFEVFVDAPVSRLSAFVTCEKQPAGAVRHLISGNARTRADYFGDLEVFGQFRNPYPFRLSSLARIDYVTRGSDGTINGGGYTYPDSSVPSGATIGWQISNFALPGTMSPASVDFTVEAESD